MFPVVMKYPTKGTKGEGVYFESQFHSIKKVRAARGPWHPQSGDREW